MKLKSAIESLLFLSNRPLTAAKIASMVQAPAPQVEQALSELYKEYAGRQGGVKLLRTGKEWQIGTAPENADLAAKFLREELTGELTTPQLEALTIIAYRGPVTKNELEQIRGVNCGLILRNLLIRGLIQSEADKKINTIYYSVTMDFLKFLGLTSVEELPNYERLHSNEIIEAYFKQIESANQ